MTDGTRNRWPLDLMIFAAIYLVWAVLLLLRAYSGAHPGSTEPFQDVVFGVKLYDNQARLAMAVQSLIFGASSVGILLRKRWGLHLALVYWLYVAASQLLFMGFYFNDESQRGHVYNAEVLLLPMMAIVFYVWYRRRSVLRGA